MSPYDPPNPSQKLPLPMSAEDWKPCIILGIPAIFIEHRLNQDDLDKINASGYHLVWIRHLDDDWAQPISLDKNRAYGNWFGEAVFDADGYSKLEFEGDKVYFADYVKKGWITDDVPITIKKDALGRSYDTVDEGFEAEDYYTKAEDEAVMLQAKSLLSAFVQEVISG